MAKQQPENLSPQVLDDLFDLVDAAVSLHHALHIDLVTRQHFADQISRCLEIVDALLDPYRKKRK